MDLSDIKQLITVKDDAAVRRQSMLLNEGDRAIDFVLLRFPTCIIPGQFEAEFAERTKKAGGLLFSENEILGFNKIANECGHPIWEPEQFKKETKES